MECNFVVGQKVIYLGPDPAFKPTPYFLAKMPNRAVAGNIYTIRDIIPDEGVNTSGFWVPFIMLHLQELHNPKANWLNATGETVLKEWGFNSNNFRPLQTSDMEWFRHLVENPHLKIADTNEFVPNRKEKVS